jgi:hypothetical protein
MDNVFLYMEYCKLIDSIMVIHKQQAQIRARVFTIFLGTCAIVGVLLFAQLNIPNIRPTFVASIIPWLGILLIHRQLRLDLVLNEGIRMTNLSNAIKMEKNNPILPHFCLSMINLNNLRHHGSAHKKAIFYFGCVLILLFASDVCLNIYANLSWWGIGLVQLPFFGLFVAYIKWTTKKFPAGKLIFGALDE